MNHSRSILLTAVLILCAGISWAANAWEFTRAVEIKDAGTGAVAVELDEKVLDAARSDLADVRVHSGTSQTPYFLTSQPEVSNRRKIRAKVAARETRQTETVLDLDLEEAGTYNEIRLIPKRSNFFRKITLEGSDDRSNWTVIRKEMLVYGLDFHERTSYLASFTNETYEGYSFGRYTSENLSFEFPKASFRYIRVTVPHGRDKEPVELEDAEIFETQKISAVERPYACTVIKTEPDPAAKSVELTVDLGSRNLPVERIEIDSPSDNFARRVEVFSSNDLKEWRSEGGGMIFSVSLYGAASSGNQIRLGETKARYFKLTLYHGDNKPVKISKVTAYGLKKFAVFLPAADKKYSLSYGNSRAEAPSYDTARVLKDKQLQDFTQARLSGEIKNEDFVPAADVKPWTETKPYLLWAAMGAIGLGLAGLAIQVMKKTDEK